MSEVEHLVTRTANHRGLTICYIVLVELRESFRCANPVKGVGEKVLTLASKDVHFFLIDLHPLRRE